MGDQRAYIRGRNDYYSYLYVTLSPKITLNGVSGKIISRKQAFRTKHADLPAYSKTCDIYFHPGEDGKPNRAKVYDPNKRMVKDFDWDHDHTNPDGTFFKKGTIHVQEYVRTRVRDPKTGKMKDKFKRLSKKARRLNTDEIQKYGPIIKYFNPDIKF